MAVMVSLAWAYSGDVQACPRGGSAALADWLATRIAADGGQIALRRRVAQVLLDGTGQAAGVQLEDGRRIAARYVIAACESHTLYERMLPDGAVPARLRRALQQADRQHSCFNVFLGLDCDPSAFGLGEEALHLTRSEQRRCEHSGGDPQRSLITLLAPSLRDPSLAPPGQGTMIVHMPARFADHDHWATGPDRERGAGYRQLKTEIADILLDRVAAAVAPRLREHIVVKEIATPITYWRYTGNLHGSISGVMPTGRNIRAGVAHQKTPVKRLLLGGHCAVYGGGVPMAVRSGANAALIVLHDLNHAGYRELKGVMTGTKA
jgi:prolycopene isomerase